VTGVKVYGRGNNDAEIQGIISLESTATGRT
jgi:hypothetical protein